MLITAIVLFAVAAVFGLVALNSILKNKPTSRPVVFIHGGVAAIALVLVILYSVGSTVAAPVASLVVFVAAALGGFVMFAKDIRQQSVPKLLAIAHPILAVIGLLLLIFFAASN